MAIVKSSEPMELRAGPLRCHYADGELRYITLGETELVRRIFFAVRTKTWDTIVPTALRADVTVEADHFLIRLDARCERGADGYDSDGYYGWKGTIEGRADGTITFAVSGEPTRPFSTNRLGLCVLFGTPTVCDRPYTVTAAADGKPRPGRFPKAVNAPLMFEPEFSALRYTAVNGAEVAVALTGSKGTVFSMEDQRNFADSSFKAYAPLPYDYPNLAPGQRFDETITLTVRGGQPVAAPKPQTEVALALGRPVANRVVPPLRTGSTGERNWFHGINHEREKTRSAPTISFAYFPVEHNYDNDTCWENVPCLVELAESARQIAPGKPIEIHHVALTLTHPRPVPEPRNASPFGAAWLACCVKYAALAGVASVTTDFGPGYAQRVQRALMPLVGKPLREVTVTHTELTPPIDAFGAGEAVVVANRTERRQKAALHGLAPGRWQGLELHGQTAPGVLPPPSKIALHGGIAHLNLAPYEVRIITPAR